MSVTEYMEMPDHGERRRSWILRRELGAVEVWMAVPVADSRWSAIIAGGVELHFRAESSTRSPTYPRCPILHDGPCIHDGSSLGFLPISDLMAALNVGAGDVLPPEVLTQIEATALSWADSYSLGGPLRRRGRWPRRRFAL